jgi:plastocyanin
MRATLALLLLVSLSELAVACSGDAADTTPAATPGASASKKVDAATAGSISGRVQFEGAIPPAGIIAMSSDRNCVSDGPPSRPSDALLVDDGRGVGNSFVYVKEGLDSSYTFDTPTTPVELDQKGCYYTPRVIGVRVGQPIDILNSDPTLHNVHALPMVNQEFNHPQPKQNMRMTKTFTAPEVMVRFKCDVHSWMSAFVGVMAHPYFAVTQPSGEFTIPNLPPGTYTLETWHEKLGTKTMQVTVAPGQSQTAAFTMSVAAK